MVAVVLQDLGFRAQGLGFRVVRSAVAAARRETRGTGLHSSTFRLNVSAFCGIGAAVRGCLGGV